MCIYLENYRPIYKYLVPGGGVEPPRAEARRILSPLRLPVPPSRRRKANYDCRSSLIRILVSHSRSTAANSCPHPMTRSSTNFHCGLAVRIDSVVDSTSLFSSSFPFLALPFLWAPCFTL